MSRLLTTTQAAGYLGISPNHLRTLVSAGRISGFKLPGTNGKIRANSPLRYHQDDLDAYASDAAETYARTTAA